MSVLCRCCGWRLLYTLGGYEEFRVPEGFPFGDKVEGVTIVGSASMLILSSRHFLFQY